LQKEAKDSHSPCGRKGAESPSTSMDKRFFLLLFAHKKKTFRAAAPTANRAVS
jgi:hypothetical protein